MRINIYTRARVLLVGLVSLAMFALPLQTLAQTKISYHSNKYKPSDDVRIGQQQAAEVEQKMPVIHDEEITAYIEKVGQRLVAAVPPEFQHPEFRYSFHIISAREINAFALPGGPMFVNSGMILAAREEGEMAGVMAHELSHVVLRHGTAQATKAQKYSWIAGALGVGGAVVGGPALGQLGQGAVGVYFLHFSREYETEADILGAQIMARAGYDPHDLANMFKTIEQQSGGKSGGGFMSDHPSPANRYERINQEAQMLPVSNPIRYSEEFTHIQQLLRSGRFSSNSNYGRSSSQQRYPNGNQRYPNSGQRYPDDDDQNYPNGSQQRYPNSQRYPDDNQRYPNDNQRYPNDSSNYPNNSQRYPRNGGGNYPNGNYPNGNVGGRVATPSTSLRTYNGNQFRLNYPDNWRVLSEGDSTWIVPEGGYGQVRGQSVYTHGVNLGVAQAQSRDLRQATDAFVDSLTRDNGNLRPQSGSQRTVIDRRDAYSVTLTNTNEATGRPERVTVYTTLLRNGDLFYMIAVAPQDDYSNFQLAFNRVLNSIQLND